MKKIIMLILMSTMFCSCSGLFWSTTFSGETSNVYSKKKEILDNHQVIMVSISNNNHSPLLFGPIFIPIIPMSLPPIYMPCHFEVSIKIYKNESLNIKRISSVIAYNQDNKMLNPYGRDGKYTRLHGQYYDTLIYNKLSKIYEGKNEQLAEVQRYICFFKTYRKIKKLILEIKYINNEDEEIVLPPFQYDALNKIKYVPLLSGPGTVGIYYEN